MVQALAIGMSEEDFWKSNPHKIKFHLEAYKLKKKNEISMNNEFAWLQGVYISHAIGSCFSKKHSYPKDPLKIDTSKKELTEDEKEVQRKKLIYSLRIMQQNFEMNHKD